MKTAIITFGLAGFLGAGLLSAPAATHYLVPTNAGADHPFTNWATAGTSAVEVVRAALADAAAPRIVWVSNGVYALTNTIRITNGVVLQSVNGRDAVRFDGGGQWRFTLEHSNGVMDGLTISNGFYSAVPAHVTFGGGIGIVAGLVTNCLITDCVTTQSRAGGIEMRGTCTVANCTIRNNRMCKSGDGGGGIKITGGPATIMNCIIEGNIASNYGGGIMVGYHSAVIRNCLIRNNSLPDGSYYGGGLAINSATNVLVANCTIVSNYASANGGGLFFSNFSEDDPTNRVVNCLIVSNKCASSAYDNIFDFSTWGPPLKHPYAVGYSCSTSNNAFILDERGNTTNAPGFIDFEGGNYRVDAGSPCYNAGTNQAWMAGATDLDGRPRQDRFSRQVDMGAYEFSLGGALFFLK